MDAKSLTLRSLGTIGVCLFGLLYLVTFLSSETLETSAKGFVKLQIEKDIKQKQKNLSQSDLASQALSIAEKLGMESEQIQQDINNNLPEKIAQVVAAMCGYDCEKKKAVAQSITAGYLDRLKNIEIAQDTLGNVIKGKYIEIVGKLKTDIRIFLVSNFFMFLLLLVVSFFKPQAVVHLFVPGVLLFVSTVISSSIYIFGQDWFYTILYNDYMGFGYLTYIGLIFGLLMDVVLNKARITAEVVNGVASAIGSAFSVVPC